MATMSVLRGSDRPAQRWRNGGGTTWQVAAAGAEQSTAGFDWRVSIAEIAEAGDFSAFPGIDRTIAVIRGAGVRLTVDGEQSVLGPMEPRSFSGDSVTSCELIDGSTLDLNLMTTRGRFAGSMVLQPVRGTVRLSVDLPGEELVVVVIAGTATVGVTEAAEGAGRQVLAPLDALRSDEPVELSAEEAIVAVLRVHPLH